MSASGLSFATAISEHPVAADAVGEILGEIVETRGIDDAAGPDVVMVFASGGHARFLGEITTTVRAVLDPAVVAGASASGVLGGVQESEGRAALSIWAAWGVRGRSLRLAPSTLDDGVLGLDAVTLGSTLVLLADPFSFPTAEFLGSLSMERPDLTVVGGLASAGDHPGANTLVLDDHLLTDGAVALAFDPGVATIPVISQGCRPVGAPLVVTRADGRFLVELAGRPALDRLSEVAAAAPPEDRALLAAGVHLGVVIDESRHEFGPGDFLVRGVLGADRARGVLAVAGAPSVGTTVQFHVRDARSASHDLHQLLADVTGRSALAFSCVGRGRALFGDIGHDAAAVSARLDRPALAGMFCAGEVGPVGGRNFVHSSTASVLVFDDR